MNNSEIFDRSKLKVGLKMSSKKDYFSKYPRQIRANMTASAPLYVLKSGHYAVQHRSANIPAPGAVLLLDDGAIAVFQGEPGEAAEASQSGDLSPVYGLQPSGLPAVPTGRIFVRFAEGVQAESRRQEINRAGYELVESLAYAPHAAWLRPRSGDIADALTGIPQLEQLPHIENVEPQMLLESVRRQ
jgi:hypothetical protein